MVKKVANRKKVEINTCVISASVYNAPPLTRNNAITRGSGRKRKSGKLKNNA